MKKLIKTFALFLCLNSVIAQSKKETVLFDYDKYYLTAEAKAKLDAAVSGLNLNQLKEVTLYGNTDADGNQQYNVELSKNRSKAVSDYLASKGIPANKIKLNFFGENKPVAQNSIESGKQLNRRVDLVFEFEGKEYTNTIFSKLETESQYFEGKSNQEIVINGKQGTKISIPRNSLMKENGKYAVGKIKIELKEFYKKSDMVLANLHTMSDDVMLESGGMVYVSATLNGEKLELKKNANMTIEFGSKDNQKDMQVFYGHPKKDNINWSTNETDVPLVEESPGGYARWITVINGKVISTDSIAFDGEKDFVRDDKTNKQLDVINKTILKSAKLNWINCDRFYEVENKTNLIVDMDMKYKPVIRLVFKDINSIMAGTLSKNNDKFVFGAIPVGKKATLVAFSTVDDETYMAMQDVVIDKDGKIGLELQKTTLDDLKSRLARLD